MGQQYYVVENGQQVGPYEIEDLKSKSITKDTLVWTDGLGSWTKAGHIPLLKEILRAIPPPIPSGVVNDQSIPPIPKNNSDLNSSDKYFGYEIAKRRERFFGVLIQAIILLIPILILFESSNDESFLMQILSSTIFSAILGMIFYPIWSGNLGHKLLGLKVISAKDGSDQNSAKAGAIREGLKNIFSYFLIPAIWLLWDQDKQNLYDKYLKTYVVRKK
ncbi:MAG: RDD family protein [Bacteroidetes bacterium]|nr:RDD family protein [Bacteroidota bacterium]